MRRLLLTSAVIVACGPAEEKAGDSAPASPAQQSLMIMAQEFTFDAPDSVPAGFTRVSLMNHGAEPHHAIFVRLDSGHVAGELLDALSKRRIPPWAVFVGGPNVTTQPLSETVVELTPGNYVMICAVSSPDGTPHVAKGMVRQLKVTPSTAQTVAPTPDLTITMADHSFTPSAPITPGPHVIRVDNNGPQPHELLIVKLQAGKTIEEYMAWARKPDGPRPGELVGGTTPQTPGIPNYVIADFTPGDYGLICFIADAKDGKPHAAHGMIHRFTVG